MKAQLNDKVNKAADAVMDFLATLWSWLTASWVEGYEPPRWARFLFLLTLPISWPATAILYFGIAFTTVVVLLIIITGEAFWRFVKTMAGVYK